MDPEKRIEAQRANYLNHRAKRLATQAAYQAAHQEERAAYAKRWVNENGERVRDYHTAYRNSDMPGAVRMRAKTAEYSKKSRAANLEKRRERGRDYSARRRAKGAQTEVVTISQALFDADGLCHLCGAPIRSAREAELDHIMPLSQGGQHTRDNLAPAHARCNRIKRGLHPDSIPPHIVMKFIKERVSLGCSPPNWPMQ